MFTRQDLRNHGKAWSGCPACSLRRVCCVLNRLIYHTQTTHKCNSKCSVNPLKASAEGILRWSIRIFRSECSPTWLHYFYVNLLQIKVSWKYGHKKHRSVTKFPVNHGKKNQLDAQLILSLFRQTLHVSGISGPIIRRYNRMCTTIGTYYFFLDDCCPGCPTRASWYLLFFLDDCLLSWLNNQDNRQSSKKNNKYQLLYTYGCTSWWWA